MNAPRSGCPINLTLEALGDRWSLIVIRDRQNDVELSPLNSMPYSGDPSAPATTPSGSSAVMKNALLAA